MFQEYESSSAKKICNKNMELYFSLKNILGNWRYLYGSQKLESVCWVYVDKYFGILTQFSTSVPPLKGWILYKPFWNLL